MEGGIKAKKTPSQNNKKPNPTPQNLSQKKKNLTRP